MGRQKSVDATKSQPDPAFLKDNLATILQSELTISQWVKRLDKDSASDAKDIQTLLFAWDKLNSLFATCIGFKSVKLHTLQEEKQQYRFVAELLANWLDLSTKVGGRIDASTFLRAWAALSKFPTWDDHMTSGEIPEAVAQDWLKAANETQIQATRLTTLLQNSPGTQPETSKKQPNTTVGDS